MPQRPASISSKSRCMSGCPSDVAPRPLSGRGAGGRMSAGAAAAPAGTDSLLVGLGLLDEFFDGGVDDLFAWAAQPLVADDALVVDDVQRGGALEVPLRHDGSR